jgi:Raf kinase inhibitor-like YbhB/YbcL family protein
MKWKSPQVIGAVVAVILLCAFIAWIALQPPVMTLTSTAFSQGGMIPVQYTCKGTGMSPPLTVRNVPKGTKSIVIILIDPDVPHGSFVHWLAFGLDPKGDIAAGIKVPQGHEGLNGAKKVGYTPPCPPSGRHRYIFTAYAMSTQMSFKTLPDIDTLKRAMQGNVLDRVQLMALYGQ